MSVVRGGNHLSKYSNYPELSKQKNLHWKSFDFSSDTSFYINKFLIPTRIPQLINHKETKRRRLQRKSKNSHWNIFNCNNFWRFVFKKTSRSKRHVALTESLFILRLLVLSCGTLLESAFFKKILSLIFVQWAILLLSYFLQVCTKKIQSDRTKIVFFVWNLKFDLSILYWVFLTFRTIPSIL